MEHIELELLNVNEIEELEAKIAPSSETSYTD